MQQWKKLGNLFNPMNYYQKKQIEWFCTHAQNPFIEIQQECDIIRIHFATRDRNNRSRGAYIDILLHNDNLQVQHVSESPTLDLGPLGAFDDAGAMPHSLIKVGNYNYLYYTGWSKCVDVPFSFHIGLAISKDQGKTYQKYSLAPVLGRNYHDPYITGAPYVICEDGLFKMWYVSGTQWEKDSKHAFVKHYYTLKYATSSDGIHWQTNSHLCLEYAPGEYAIARPVVRKISVGYEMVFSFRGGDDTYRVGRALSKDGVEWQRDKEVLLNVSPQGWDSEMVCYAFPFEHKHKQYLLYNGNNYGKTGIGIAVLE